MQIHLNIYLICQQVSECHVQKSDADCGRFIPPQQVSRPWANFWHQTCIDDGRIWSEWHCAESFCLQKKKQNAVPSGMLLSAHHDI